HSVSSSHQDVDMAQSVPPGDIATQPGTKIVFNAPYDDKHTYHIKVTNSSARRIGWAFKTTNMKRLGVDPAAGVLDPKENALIAVSCDAFAYGQESVPPGDIATQPGTKIVFNAPYDDKHTYHIKVTNSSARRIGWAFKTTNMKRLGVDPAAGVLDPKENALIAVSCDAFAYGQEDTNNDRITIEWTNTPDGAAKQFRREWFQGDGMVLEYHLVSEMSWVYLYVPDFILTPSFVYFLVVLILTKDGTLRTPFFSFFIATGICGIPTVVTHILMNRVIWPVEVWWIQIIVLIINQSAQLGATIGKFLIVLHRYFVLRGVIVNEDVWSVSTVRHLIFLQVILPFLLTGSFFSFGYTVQATVNGSISFIIASQGLVMQKAVNTSFMIFYSLVCLLLTFLSSRHLNELSGRFGVKYSTTKRAIVKQQKNMFIIVSVCCISHVLKATQQSLVVTFSLNGTIDRSLYENLLWP
ncbi:hypothetical protein PMAYCL1PPCAC_23210, partial [Pristionchus mayeri]